MVFVVLGTQDKPFPRLLELVESEIKEGHITEDVIVQNGITKFKSNVMQLIPFMDMDVFESYISKADFIISHAGYGTLSTALKHGKKIIGVARLKKYGEHTNDHQLQILKEYEEKGYLIALHEEERLSIPLAKIAEFSPAPYKDNTEQLCALVEKCINE